MKPKYVVHPNSNSMSEHTAKWLVVFEHNDNRTIVGKHMNREAADADANRYNKLLKGVK
jgi:hypothetical protein